MIESLFENTLSSLSVSNAFIIVFISVIMGFIISAIYMLINKKNGYSYGFVLTLVMLPATISIIILLVGNSIARAFSLAGAFSLIRFRSNAGSTKDIAFIFFSLAVGLACGIGYVAYGIMFTILLSMVILFIHFTGYGNKIKNQAKVKIVVPEDLNYEEEFSKILSKYCKRYNIVKIKTVDFGSLYEISYKVEMKNIDEERKLIDELRVKNGNLQINITSLEMANDGDF